ncbi:MAG: MFS transporter [Candidatus Lokiarchaeota archaeon]|nr:MFS transporter [Candidatus Lokiarchaeota archaeon]
MEQTGIINSNNKDLTENLPTDQEKFRSFIFLLIGQLTSLFGSSIVMFTIILWITIETKSAPILSITSFLSFAPVIILIPFTGVYADRWNKKKIIIISDLSQAIFTLGLIIMFLVGAINLIPILVLIVLRGFGQAFHQPAIAAIVPFMVPQKYLSKINSISFLLMGLLNIISPIIASFLMTFLTIGQILWIDIITFSIALVPSVFLKLPIDKRRRRKKSKFVKDFKEGLSAFKKVEGLISLLIIFAGISFFAIPFYILTPYYIEVTRSGTPFDLALVMAYYQGGIVAGALIVMIKKKWKKYVLTMIQLMYFQLLGIFFYLFAPEGAFWLLGIGPLILGFATAIINALLMTLIQTIIPPRKQGRAMSLLIVITSSVAPIGMILSGFFADLLGIYAFFWLCVILMAEIVTIGVFFTKILSIDKITKDKMKAINE